jgi:hypothetical protein
MLDHSGQLLWWHMILGFVFAAAGEQYSVCASSKAPAIVSHGRHYFSALTPGI